MLEEIKINFVAVGPQRTATTWLHKVLSNKVILPTGVNEPMFFDKHYNKGMKWYISHFVKKDGIDVVGEIAPTYFHSKQARKRIVEHFPNCKILCTLRDPVDRLYSLYRLMREYGMTKYAFEDAIEKEKIMIESSRYAYHVRQWIEMFGEKNVLVMFHDELKTDSQEYIERICKFIGINSFQLVEKDKQRTEKEYPARSYFLAKMGQTVADWLRSNRLYWLTEFGRKVGIKKMLIGGGRDLPKMDEELEKRLREFFVPEIESLEKLLNRDLSGWKQKI